MKIRFNYLYIAILIVFCIIIVGCTADKSKVKLTTSKEVLKYVKKHYGTATIQKETRDEESVSFIMKDKMDSFTYECYDRIYEVCMDATCGGLYYNRLNCNFEEEYAKHVVNKLELSNILDIHIYSKETLTALHYKNEEAAKKDAKKIIEKIKEIDKRKVLLNYNIDIYDDEENYLGIYNIKTGKYMNYYEEKIEDMTYSFARVVHKTTNDLSGIKYLYYKKIQYKDVDRLKIEWLHDKNIKEDDWTAAYYFKYEGKTYFILPDIVFIENEEDIEGNHLSEKYTSYWFK